MMVFVSPPLNAQSFRQPTFKTGKPIESIAVDRWHDSC